MRRAALSSVLVLAIFAAGCETGSSYSAYTFTSPPPTFTAVTTVRPAKHAYAVPPPTRTPAVSAAKATSSVPIVRTPARIPTLTPAQTHFSAPTPAPAPAPVPAASGSARTVLANDQTFDRELATATTPVILNFTAKWCGPCHAVAPVIDALVADKAGQLKAIRVDFDQSPQTVRRFGISALPAILVVKNGVVVKRMVGYQSRENLNAALASVGP